MMTTKTWKGADAYWTIGADWTPTGEPVSTDDAVINGDASDSFGNTANEQSIAVDPSTTAATPGITSVTWNNSTETVVILGSGFGTQAAYNGDSGFIKIGVPTVFSAGYDDPGIEFDLVTLDVTSWTNTQITIQGFTGAYGEGNWVFEPGDSVVVYVANASATPPGEPPGSSFYADDPAGTKPFFR
jgi:hypothetical protein